MFKTNFLTYFSEIILDFVFKILYFPLWWYGPGTIKKIRKCYNFLKDKEESLGLFIWCKNILVPMYGQNDFAGRVISFFVRFFQILFRSIIMLFWLFFAFIKLLIWLFFPPALLFALIFQIF